MHLTLHLLSQAEIDWDMPAVCIYMPYVLCRMLYIYVYMPYAIYVYMLCMYVIYVRMYVYVYAYIYIGSAPIKKDWG